VNDFHLIDRLLGKDQILQAPQGSSLCLYPFFSLLMTANGKYKPCCKWHEVLHHKGKELQAPQDSFSDAWHSDEMVQLRQKFLNAEKPPKCSVCWKEEESGIRSMRYDSFDYQLRKNILKSPNTPKRLDLYPSNVCNLKCRICSPEYSSKWIPEAKETLGSNESVHLNFTEENLALIKTWLPGIIELGFFGGEPLYLKETIQLLQYCVEQGYSKSISLLINTNATIYSDELADLFKQFKKVLLNFSIDDIGERFEYQRKGAIWAEVVSNISKYIAAGGCRSTDQIECKICCTVSTLNIYYLPELYQWFADRFPELKIYLNFLHGPYALSVISLPDEVKKILCEHFNSNTGAIRQAKDEKLTRTIENIIEFLNTKPNVSFQEFFKELERGDNYRKESYPIIFPEWWKILSPYRQKRLNE